jgi:hypothetical protein
MSKPSIADILALQFVGNYFGDQDAFARIHEFAMDAGNPVADRAAAIRHMEQAGMGIDPSTESDSDLVASYVEDLE